MPRRERTSRSHASTTSRLRLAFVRAARTSSARRSVDGRWTVVVGTMEMPLLGGVAADGRVVPGVAYEAAALLLTGPDGEPSLGKASDDRPALAASSHLRLSRTSPGAAARIGAPA